MKLIEKIELDGTTQKNFKITKENNLLLRQVGIKHLEDHNYEPRDPDTMNEALGIGLRSLLGK